MCLYMPLDYGVLGAIMRDTGATDHTLRTDGLLCSGNRRNWHQKMDNRMCDFEVSEPHVLVLTRHNRLRKPLYFLIALW